VVDREGRAIVLDFGLARRLRGEDAFAAESRLTAQHALAGTLGYMAPRVLLGSAADARSDIWPVAVVLYQVASGTLPLIPINVPSAVRTFAFGLTRAARWWGEYVDATSTTHGFIAVPAGK
jgi:serine/threonine protein kinase